MEAIMSIQQGSAQRAATENLLDHAASLPETVRVMALTGTTDFVVHVAVRDMEHLRDLVWNLIERREVARIQSSLVLAKVEGPSLVPLDD
jgi:DNA-binding Lrp family transcriptional regulator